MSKADLNIPNRLGKIFLLLLEKLCNVLQNIMCLPSDFLHFALYHNILYHFQCIKATLRKKKSDFENKVIIS